MIVYMRVWSSYNNITASNWLELYAVRWIEKMSLWMVVHRIIIMRLYVYHHKATGINGGTKGTIQENGQIEINSFYYYFTQ